MNTAVGSSVVTIFEDDDSVFAAMRAGVKGHVLKGADQETILKHIRAVAAGKVQFGLEIARCLTSFSSAK